VLEQTDREVGESYFQVLAPVGWMSVALTSFFVDGAFFPYGGQVIALPRRQDFCRWSWRRTDACQRRRDHLSAVGKKAAWTSFWHRCVSTTRYGAHRGQPSQNNLNRAGRLRRFRWPVRRRCRTVSDVVESLPRYGFHAVPSGRRRRQRMHARLGIPVHLHLERVVSR